MNMAAGPGVQFWKLLLLTLWLATSVCLSGATKHNYPIIAKRDTEALRKLLKVTPEDEWTAEEKKLKGEIDTVRAAEAILESDLEYVKDEPVDRMVLEDEIEAIEDLESDLVNEQEELIKQTRDNRNPTDIEDSEYSEEEYDFTDYTQDYSDNSREHFNVKRSDREESQDYSKEDYSDDDIEEIEELLTSRDKRRAWTTKRKLSEVNKRNDLIYAYRDKFKEHFKHFLQRPFIQVVQQTSSLEQQFSKLIKSVEATQKTIEHQIKSLKKKLGESRTRREDHGSSNKQQYSKPVQRRDTFETAVTRNPTEIEDSEYSEEEYDFTDYTQDYSNNSREHLSEESDFSERDSEDTSKASQSDREESQDHSEDYSKENNQTIQDYSEEIQINIRDMEQSEEYLSRPEKWRVYKRSVEAWLRKVVLQKFNVEYGHLQRATQPFKDSQKRILKKINALENQVPKIKSLNAAQKQVEHQIKSMETTHQKRSLEKQLAGSRTTPEKPNENSHEHLSEESDFSERDTEDTSKASQSDREESQDHSEDYMSGRYKRYDVLNIDDLKQMLVEKNKKLLEPMLATQKVSAQKIKSLEKEVAILKSVEAAQKEAQRRIKSLNSPVVTTHKKPSVTKPTPAAKISHPVEKPHNHKPTKPAPIEKPRDHKPKTEQQIESLERQVPKIRHLEATLKGLKHQLESLKKQLADSRITREEHGRSNKQQYSKPPRRH